MLATTLGMKNLARVATMLLDATTTQNGDPYRELTEVYGRLVSQWTLEMNHVTQLVGGDISQQKHIGQAGRRFTPVPRARQASAVQFLLSNAFIPPMFLVQPDLLRRMEPAGAINRVRNAQSSVMNSLLQPDRLTRLVEQTAVDGVGVYTVSQFLADLRRGIWSELTTPAKPIDQFRRNVQRIYLDALDARLNNSGPPPEIRALLRGETVTHRGRVTVLDGKLYSLPEQSPLLLGAAVTEATAELVGGWADGLLTVSARPGTLKRVVEAFRRGAISPSR